MLFSRVVDKLLTWDKTAFTLPDAMHSVPCWVKKRVSPQDNFIDTFLSNDDYIYNTFQDFFKLIMQELQFLTLNSLSECCFISSEQFINYTLLIWFGKPANVQGLCHAKESLNILYDTDSINRRKTDNAIAKRKGTTIHVKLKIGQHEPL
jgi:hypothetical protein